MEEVKTTAAILLAAGRGTRMGTEVQKQFLMLEGFPLLYYSLKAFEESQVDDLILVTGEADRERCRQIVEQYGIQKVRAIVAGGQERYHSVYAGLKQLPKNCSRVLIHDGARPFIEQAVIERAIAGIEETGACVIAVPSKDTIKIADDQGFASDTPKRSRLWVIQTPQAFERSLICQAYQWMMERPERQEGITDDAMAVERMTDRKVKLVEGSYENIKVTTPEDMEIGKAILRRRFIEQKDK